MLVKEWMTTDPLTLGEDDIVQDAVALSMKHRIRHIPIVNDGKLVGIVTDRDLKRALPSILAGVSPEQHQQFMKSTSVGKLMTRSPLTVSPESHLRDAAKVFSERKIGALPVVSDGKLVGILSETDMMRAFLQLLGED